MTKTAEIADAAAATPQGEHGGVFTCADRGFPALRAGEVVLPPATLSATGEIICLLASEMGYPMHYDNNQQIWDEMRELCPRSAASPAKKWAI